MERAPGEESPTGAASSEAGPPAESHRSGPAIDVSPALHAAGHEVHDLGWDDVPDTGPVVHPDEQPRHADPFDTVVRMPTD